MKKIFMTLTLAFAAAIAIPSIATAQDVKPEQTKECCKANKDCKKTECKNAENKDCKNACDSQDKCKKGTVDKKRMKKTAGPRMQGHSNKIGTREGNNPLFNGITLSAEQQQKMKALKEKQREAHKEMRSQKKAENKKVKADRRAEYKKRNEAFEKEVEKILTPDQLKQYNANKAELKKEKK